ncbi:MAG: F0F1 ATP synthase subunit A [Bacteroidetes bacterium]|nr:F0F1 ATP synthase subunit A [Bacteroidota bacterium]
MYCIHPVRVSSLKPILLSILFLFLSLHIFAEGGEGNKKFNAGELIGNHITDSHEWHIAGHLAIPLPVILYTPGKGLSASMYNKLEEGEMDGFKLDAKHNIIASDGSKFYDFSITKNVLSLFISILLMLWIFTSVAKSYKRREGQAPKGLQSALEPIILFVRDDVAKASIGEKKFMKYMPFLLTVFFFIWINNLMGLFPFFPGGANLTGNIAVTMTLALITLVVVAFSANKNYWMHIVAMPGVPKGILFLLTPIEILGFFLRPFVLMVRLFANITAGHIIALSFFSLIFIFGEMNVGVGYGVAVFSLAFTVFMAMLELLVAFLQAYVFTLLSAIYIGAATEEHHHNHDHPEAHVEEAAIV